MVSGTIYANTSFILRRYAFSLSLLIIFTIIVASKYNQLDENLHNLKKCVMPDNVDWQTLSSVINNCISEYVNTNNLEFLYLNVYQNKSEGLNETKAFLRFKKIPTNCLWLTIGIGGETRAEKELLEQYPNCRLFGIEAGEKTGDFIKYGNIISLAIGKLSFRSPFLHQIE